MDDLNLIYNEWLRKVRLCLSQYVQDQDTYINLFDKAVDQNSEWLVLVKYTCLIKSDIILQFSVNLNIFLQVFLLTVAMDTGDEKESNHKIVVVGSASVDFTTYV